MERIRLILACGTREAVQTFGATKHLQGLQTVAAHTFLDGELAGARGAGGILVELGGYHFVRTGDKEEGVRAEEVGGVSSVNKMLRSLSNIGHGFCVGWSRVSREAWVSDFAMSGWMEMA